MPGSHLQAETFPAFLSKMVLEIRLREQSPATGPVADSVTSGLFYSRCVGPRVDESAIIGLLCDCFGPLLAWSRFWYDGETNGFRGTNRRV
jgi:hypothetical protein